jgi:hypothetical protein
VLNAKGRRYAIAPVLRRPTMGRVDEICPMCAEVKDHIDYHV